MTILSEELGYKVVRRYARTYGEYDPSQYWGPAQYHEVGPSLTKPGGKRKKGKGKRPRKAAGQKMRKGRR